ncbi:MAG: hypothetical protein WB819_15525 [Terriglobia bacterium]
MTETAVWSWVALLLLGAYHGINPGMGWLFAVALGMQEKSSRAVWRSLAPMATGHALAIGVVVFLATLAGMALPLTGLKILVAGILFVLGIYRLVRHRHPRGGGMQVGFRDLTIWSFLMASAHGAGLMVLPVLLQFSPVAHAAGANPSMHPMHAGVMGGTTTSLLAVGVHTAGYLVITGAIAWLVYARLGLTLLRKAWVNLDVIWCFALLATGGFTLLL